MSNPRFTPAAPPLAQVASVTLTGYDATTTYTIAFGAVSVGVLGQGGSTTTTAAALAAALGALSATTYPAFAEVTWSSIGAVVYATANAPGVAFSFTPSVSGGAGTIGAYTVVTANSSPADWADAANWSTGAVPIAADAVYLDHSSQDVLYSLDQHTVTVASLTVDASFTGNLGLPEVNTDSQATYLDYRPSYLKIGATACTIGAGSGNGSGRLKIDFGSMQTACVVEATGSSNDPSGLEPCLLKGTHASNVLTVNGGNVAVAPLGGDVSTLATLNVSGLAVVRGGAGLTLTTLNLLGGTVILGGGLTTANVEDGGTLTIQAGNVTTANVLAGAFVYTGVGTIATLTVGATGVMDFSQDPRARTITNTIQLFSGSSFLNPLGTVSSPVFKLNECTLADVTINLPPGHTLTVS